MATPTVAVEVPARADGVELLGHQEGSGYAEQPALVRRSDGQVLQLTPLVYAVLSAVDGQRDLAGVAAAASAESGRTLHSEDVAELIEQRLRPAGLVARPDGSVAEVAKTSPLLALRPRFVVSRPEHTRRLTAPFTFLFHPVVAVPATLAFVAVAFWVLFRKGLAGAAYQAFQRPGLFLTVFAITVVSAGFHEFGHAAALRRGGGTPGAMGAGLYLFWPAFYTDVTDSYRLSRWDRLRTDLGGLYFNALVAVGTFAGWLAWRWDGLLLVIAAQLLQMVRQLPPLVRFDGYHLLADFTGVPDLYQRIGPTLRSFRRRGQPDPRALRPWARVVVTLWVLLVVPLLLLSLVVAVLALPRVLGSTAHRVAVQLAGVRHAVAAGHDAAAVVRALGIVAVVVPTAGLCLLLLRSVRRIGRTTWRRTAGKPKARAAAVAVALAAAAGLVAAWLPAGSFRPVQPYERGALPDFLPAALSGSAGLAAGHQGGTRTVWPADTPLPTVAHPALAMLLVPRQPGKPTWVFPFRQPAAPGPGGNQSLAVVTTNGGSAYRVAFGLVWATGDVVLNRNEAYAFASCTGCRAVAVSFQVVLVVGDAHVVAPQNISAAVAYHCLHCLTEAVAVQQVLTLRAAPDVATQQKLDELWAQISAASSGLQGLTFAQIQATVSGYEHQLTALLQGDLAAPAPTSSAVAGSVSPSPGVTATGSSGAASASAGPSATTGGGEASAPSSAPSTGPTTGSTADTSTAPAPAATTAPAASPTPS